MNWDKTTYTNSGLCLTCVCCYSAQGPDGELGVRGVPGETGYRGEPGKFYSDGPSAGEPGKQGLLGVKGHKGRRGFPGLALFFSSQWLSQLVWCGVCVRD